MTAAVFYPTDPLDTIDSNLLPITNESLLVWFLLPMMEKRLFRSLENLLFAIYPGSCGNVPEAV